MPAAPPLPAPCVPAHLDLVAARHPKGPNISLLFPPLLRPSLQAAAMRWMALILWLWRLQSAQKIPFGKLAMRRKIPFPPSDLGRTFYAGDQLDHLSCLSFSGHLVSKKHLPYLRRPRATSTEPAGCVSPPERAAQTHNSAGRLLHRGPQQRAVYSVGCRQRSSTWLHSCSN